MLVLKKILLYKLYFEGEGFHVCFEMAAILCAKYRGNWRRIVGRQRVTTDAYKSRFRFYSLVHLGIFQSFVIG